MIKLLSNIIKGGQLSLHAIRMFKQVFYVLMLWLIFSALIIFSLKVYRNTNTEQWLATSDYYLSSVLDGIGLGNSRLSTNYLGRKAELRASTIISSSFYKVKKEKLEQTLKESAILSGFISLGISILVGAYFIRRGVKKTEDKYRRGAKSQNSDKIRWEIRNYNRKNNYDAYTIADIPYPARAEMQHSLVIGTTGTGKTSLISNVVEQIRSRGDRAIIYDTKGCYLEWFYRENKDNILNPFDKRSEKWNLLKEIRHIGHIKSIAQAFIPEGKGNSGIWNEAGRIAFTAFIEKQLNSGEDVTNRKLADLMLRQDAREIINSLKGTYAQSIIDSKAPETTGGVLFTLSSYLNNLRLMNDGKAESFSIKEWCREASDSFLFITSNQEAFSELIPVQTVWWEIVFNGLLSKERNNKQKTWIILDEVGSLQNIPSLQDTMSKTREYGCCFILGMQDIGQLEEVYGPKQSRTISTLCNTRCVFRTPDPHTASWLSKNIGDQEVEQVKEGLSYGAHQMRDGVSVNKQNVTRPLVMSSEIQNLKDLELYIQFPNYPFIKTKIDWKDRDIRSKAYIENDRLIEEMKADISVSKKSKCNNKEKDFKNESKAEMEKVVFQSKEKQPSELDENELKEDDLVLESTSRFKF